MKITKYLTPSFEMNVKSYNSSEKIELVGNNNWKTILIANLAFLLVVGVALFFLYNYIWELMIGRLTMIVTSFAALSLNYNAIRSVRNSKYIKEKIEFSKDGIFINHTKENKTGKLIKANSLKNVKVVFDGRLFKFMLFGMNKPYFQFGVKSTAEFNSQEFLTDISNLLNLNVKDGAQFHSSSIVELEQETKSPKIKSLISQENIYSESKIKKSKKNNDFKPSSYYSYNKNNVFIIEAKAIYDRTEIPKKMWISNVEQVIWHKKFILFKEKFKFNEVSNLKFTTHFDVGENGFSHIEGNLIVITIDKKRNVVFTAKKAITGQPELIELKMIKDMNHLVKVVKDKIKKKTPNTV